jgi:hypothetical protein
VVYFILDLFGECGIFYFSPVRRVWYILFWTCLESVVYFILELFGECGIFYFGPVRRVWYILFWTCLESVVCFILDLFGECGISDFGPVLHSPNRSKIKYTTLSEQVQNKIYHTL